MKKIQYILATLAFLFLASCTEEVFFSSDTEALGTFQITAPESAATYSLNSGTPENTIIFNWSEAKPGVNKKATYSINFYKVDEENPFISFPSDEEGTLNMLTLSFANLDDALESAGFAMAEKATVQWQVMATNGDVEITTSKSNISLVRFATNGISTFNLLTPANNNIIKADIYVTPNENVSFTWNAAETTSNSGTVNYEILFDVLTGDFSSPLKTFDVANATSFNITHKEIGEIFGSNPNVKWTVKATIEGTEISLNANPNYINWDVFVINEFYLVGSHVGWDNSNATPFINKGNGAFELQIDLPANSEFKFLPQLGSWDGDWGEDPANPGKIIQDGEQNIKTVNAGRYVIKVDFPTLSFSVVEFKAPDNLFLTGSPVGWNATNGIPFYNDGNGVFSLTYNFDANAEFKFLPTNIDFSGDWGLDPVNPGAIIQEGEQNIKVENAGTYVVIVDYNSLTFKVANISTMYMVGSFVSWNASNATPFYTSGNGVFTQVQTLDAGAEFKLIPNAGSFDGDWGESQNSSGKIVQDDEQNIKAASAGTYMITVDFNELSYRLTEIPNNLYLVGSPNGWNNATAPQFTKISEGLFEITQTLVSTDEFKFLPVQGSWDNDWGESKKYAGMPVRDDEDNVKSPGNGTYTITVDYNKGTLKVQ